jgi:hypothetical protein
MVKLMKQSSARKHASSLASILREIDGPFIGPNRPSLAPLVNWGSAGDVPIRLSSAIRFKQFG